VGKLVYIFVGNILQLSFYAHIYVKLQLSIYDSYDLEVLKFFIIFDNLNIICKDGG
jgi:hypothetical protein